MMTWMTFDENIGSIYGAWEHFVGWDKDKDNGIGIGIVAQAFTWRVQSFEYELFQIGHLGKCEVLAIEKATTLLWALLSSWEAL